MNKSKLLNILGKNGDSILTVKTIDNESKKKEVICIAVTTDFKNEYIKSLKKRKFNTDGNVLVFSWTENRFRIINALDVLKIEPLSNILKNVQPEFTNDPDYFLIKSN